MQLKIQRSQRSGFTGKVLFCVDLRAAYSEDERSNINRYALGGQLIYNSQNARRHLENTGAQLDRTQSGGFGERASGLARGAVSLAMAKMSLNITIASLGRGHHIECKDLPEMLDAEETVRGACKDLTRYLDAAATFDGSETVVEYVNGEERVHIMQSAPPLLEYNAGKNETAVAAVAPSGQYYGYDPSAPPPPMFELLGHLWRRHETRIIKVADRYGIKVSPLMASVGSIAVGVLVLYVLFAVV